MENDNAFLIEKIKENLKSLEDVYSSGFIQEVEYRARKSELEESLYKVQPNLKKPQANVKNQNQTTNQTSQTNSQTNNQTTSQSKSAKKREEKKRKMESQKEEENAEVMEENGDIDFDFDTFSGADSVVDKSKIFAQRQAEVPLPLPQRPFIPMQSFVTSTSLVVMPPPDQWKQIVDIKKNHMNPRIKRPPYPHITLLQPFVDSTYWDTIAEDLRQVLKRVEPFHLSFNKFEIFANKGSATLFLNPVIEPPNALQALYKLLDDRYPESKKANQKGSTFEPHIGVGYFNQLQQAKGYQTKYQKDWVPISFTVQEIYIMNRKRQDTPFEVRKVIPLGNTPQKPHFAEKQ